MFHIFSLKHLIILIFTYHIDFLILYIINYDSQFNYIIPSIIILYINFHIILFICYNLFLIQSHSNFFILRKFFHTYLPIQLTHLIIYFTNLFHIIISILPKILSTQHFINPISPLYYFRTNYFILTKIFNIIQLIYLIPLIIYSIILSQIKVLIHLKIQCAINFINLIILLYYFRNYHIILKMTQHTIQLIYLTPLIICSIIHVHI